MDKSVSFTHNITGRFLEKIFVHLNTSYNVHGYRKHKVCYYMIIYLLVTPLHIIVSNSARAVSTETHKTAKPVSLTDQQPSYHWQIVA